MEDVGPLNLSGADTTGFQAADSGTYNCEVVRAEWVEGGTKGGENAKMPAGSPLFKLAVKIVDDVDGKGAWAWGSYSLPVASYEKANKDKAARLKGTFVNMLIGLGFSEEEITSGDFQLDPDSLIGRDCVVVVGKQPRRSDPDEFDNVIKKVKVAGSPTTAAQAAGGIL
jgi:hypothetical protein